MAVETILKQPAETLRRQVHPGGLIVSAIVSAEAAARGLIPAAAAIGVTAELAAGAVILELTGGSAGESYLVTVRVEDADGQVAEAELDVAVMDLEWAMPDGGAPYLSIAEFVARFGLPEVIAMTDGTGDGRIDRAMLVAELINAQAVADAHIAGKYAVPLGEVPLIIKKIVGDLARAALYPRGAPEGVADLAKGAMRMLERIQSGAMPLPASAPIAEAPSENPVLISPGERAYPGGLSGYAKGAWW